MSKKIHFIAVGGSVMHNLALALNRLGHEVTGSDDRIYDPARGRLEKAGLLPQEMGWHADRIHPGLDAIVLGMHAKEGNPELDKARELGLKIYSFPEYMYEHAKEKQRIAICGSHGKTTITSMVLHVLRRQQLEFDYLVGAQLENFDLMVGLSDSAPRVILEGDEYLTSPIDRRPKFLVYQPQIALISGIAWDHINVFPTYEGYVEQFRQLVLSLPENGTLVYNEEDPEVAALVKERKDNLRMVPYRMPEFEIRDHTYVVRVEGKEYPVGVIGRHNLSNLAGAAEICATQGIAKETFWESVADFRGAALRLQRIYEKNGITVFRDFAHSPSKVRATVDAVEELYGPEELVACLELHTFSSVNKDFLPHYDGSLASLKHKVLFINEETLRQKGYEPIREEEAREAFGESDLRYADQPNKLREEMEQLRPKGKVFLMMSSGNFGGEDPLKLALGNNFA